MVGIVGLTMLAGNVSTAKAQPYGYGYGGYYPGYGVYAYPYASTPYTYGYPGYYASYSPGYYGYASPGVYVGGNWGGRRGYYGRGYYGRGYYYGRHWRR